MYIAQLRNLYSATNCDDRGLINFSAFVLDPVARSCIIASPLHRRPPDVPSDHMQRLEGVVLDELLAVQERHKNMLDDRFTQEPSRVDQAQFHGRKMVIEFCSILDEYSFPPDLASDWQHNQPS